MQDPEQNIIVIDTIYRKVEIIDTIYTRVNISIADTIQPDLVTVYKEMAELQNDQFNLLLWQIGIIVTCLIFLFSFFNFIVAQRIFKTDADKIFKKNKEALIKENKKDLDKIQYEFGALFCDKSASIAFVSNMAPGPKHYYILNQFFKMIEYYIKLNDTSEILDVIHLIYEKIDEINKKDLKAIPGYFDKEKYLRIINSIPFETSNTKVGEIKDGINIIIDRGFDNDEN